MVWDTYVFKLGTFTNDMLFADPPTVICINHSTIRVELVCSLLCPLSMFVPRHCCCFGQSHQSCAVSAIPVLSLGDIRVVFSSGNAKETHIINVGFKLQNVGKVLSRPNTFDKLLLCWRWFFLQSRWLE